MGGEQMAGQPATPVFPTAPIGYVRDATINQLNVDPYELNPHLKWPLGLAVYDQMLNESQIISVMRAVKLPILATRWRVNPGGARDEVVEKVAKDLGLPVVGSDDPPPRRTAGRFSWREHLESAMLCLRYGHMAFEQQYAINDDGSASLAKLAPRLPRRIARINVDIDGGLVSIMQNPAIGANGIPNGIGLLEIPVNRLVYYTNEKEPGDWLGRSLLRAAYKNYVIKDELLRTQATMIKRNGMGIPVYTGGAPNEDLTKGSMLAQALRAGDDSGAAIPFGAVMQLIGVTGVLPDANPAIQYHDQQMARAVLAHVLNLGTQTGSWALGSVFNDLFTMSLQAIAGDIRDTAQQHVVEDIVDVNYSIDEGAPQLVFDSIGGQQQITAQVLMALRQAGLIIPDRELEQWVRDQWNMPEKTVPSPVNPAYSPDVTPAIPGKDVPAAETNTNVPV